MATTPTKPGVEVTSQLPGMGVPSWPRGQNPASALSTSLDSSNQKSTHRDALQGLLAFSALHEQVRKRRALAARRSSFDTVPVATEFEEGEQFVLDEVLQLVAERAIAITGADGLAIALAENDEIVLRASAGAIKPDVGQRIDRDSAFSGACFRKAEVVRCDDTETDDRVNLAACRRLGARSMVAVPLCGRRRVIGLLEAFSAEALGFNDSDVRHLSLLAELVLGALKPEDEDRFAESAQVAATKLEAVPSLSVEPAAAVSVPAAAPVRVEASAPKNEALPVGVKIVGVKIFGVKDEGKVNAEVDEDEPLFALATSSLAPSTLAEPVLAPEETVAPEKTEIGAAIEESHSAKHRPGMLLLLGFILIAAVVGGGVWWKVKNAQLGSAMVQGQKPALKPVPSGNAAAKPPAPAQTASAAPATNSATDANTDPLAETAESATSAASPQEVSKFPLVTGIRHWSSADSSTVVLDLQDQVQYEAHRLSNPDRIYFDLRDTRLTADLVGKSIDVGDALLTRIRVAQPAPGMTRVVLQTKGNSNFSVSLEPSPYRLVVELRKVGASPKGAVNLFPNEVEAMNRLAIVVPPPTKEDLQLRTRVPKMRIVVDAGHGGWDLGTVGRRGLLEKDLVLEIGQRLGKLLESRLGAEIIYTRHDDNYVPLDERAGIANQSQADLFVSVHANYSDLPSARGVETYYTNFFSAPDAKNMEAGGNGGGKSAVTATLSAAELHDRIEQSRRLAASVQRSLYGTLSVKNPGLRDRGVKAAGFVVLTETAMPGILAEVSFVSSPTDEQKLRSDGYREQIAEALYKGIARYAANSRGVKVASAAK
jgi:N-acetylmuramoyl-L-alanine amidase/putative methionine-R-sulfoxide reductase with GAF domain